MALVLVALAAGLAFTGAAVRIGEDIAVKEEHKVDAGTESNAWWNFPAPSRYKKTSGTQAEMDAMKKKWDDLSDAAKIAEYTAEFDDDDGNFSKALDELADNAKKRDKINPFQTGFKVWSFNAATRRNRVKLNVLKRAIEAANRAIKAEEAQRAAKRKEAEDSMQRMLDKIDQEEDDEDNLLRMTERTSGRFSITSQAESVRGSRMIESGDSEAYIPDRASAEYGDFRLTMRQSVILGSAALGGSLSMDLDEHEEEDEDDMMVFDKSGGGGSGMDKKFGGQSMASSNRKSMRLPDEDDDDMIEEMQREIEKPQHKPKEIQKQKESFKLTELPNQQSMGSSQSNRNANNDFGEDMDLDVSEMEKVD